MSNDTLKSFILRPTEKSDLSVLSYWFQDVTDLACFDRARRIPANNEQTELLWSDITGGSAKDENCWFTIESDAKEAVGLVGLDTISYCNRDAVMPLFVQKSIRRRGVGIRACALVLDLAFRQLGLNRVTSYVRADNLSSKNLLSQLGFQIEGTLRQAWFSEGQFHDMIAVGILLPDWMDRRRALARELHSETLVMLGPDASPEWSWPLRDHSDE